MKGIENIKREIRLSWYSELRGLASRWGGRTCFPRKRDQAPFSLDQEKPKKLKHVGCCC